MRKTADAAGAGKTGLINGVVVGQRGLSREEPLYIYYYFLSNYFSLICSYKIFP